MRSPSSMLAVPEWRLLHHICFEQNNVRDLEAARIQTSVLCGALAGEPTPARFSRTSSVFPTGRTIVYRHCSCHVGRRFACDRRKHWRLGRTGQACCAVANQDYIDWVHEEVLPLQYSVHRRVFTYNWPDEETPSEQMEAGGSVTAGDIVVMTQTSPDRCGNLPRRLA